MLENNASPTLEMSFSSTDTMTTADRYPCYIHITQDLGASKTTDTSYCLQQVAIWCLKALHHFLSWFLRFGFFLTTLMDGAYFRRHAKFLRPSFC